MFTVTPSGVAQLRRIMKVLTEREKHLIGIACIMKIRHFENPKIASEFNSTLVESCILEYRDILDKIGFRQPKLVRYSKSKGYSEE